VPQENVRAITLPADPTPVYYPSVEDFVNAETDFRVTSVPPTIDPTTGIPIPGGALRTTMDDENRTVEPFGAPVGLSQNAVMPYNGAVQKAFGVPLQVISVIGDGTATVTVTCSAVHNLHTDDQISVEGLSFGPACGFFSVDVTTATQFTYMTYGSNPADSLLTSTTRIVTCLVGLPR
jgi:hypothetical protein